MFPVFNTALSGLSAMAEAVDVVGNNLANLNTTGYKASNISFHDLMSIQMGANGSQVGTGVSAPDLSRSFSQGAIQATTGAFDAAVQGQGFFVVQSPAGQQLYTRAGNFNLDATGHLMTATGEYVQGWNANAGVLNPTGAVSNIVVPINGVNPAKPTANMSFNLNLNSAGVVGATSGTYAVPMQVVDSQGGTHTVTVTFTKSDNNKWDYSVDVPAADLAKGGTTQLAKGTVSFGADGQLDPKTATPVAIKLTGLADGAADQTVNWNIMNPDGTGTVTQFAQSSGVAASTQDGVMAGQITSVGLANGGLVVAKYSNGAQQVIGQVAVASISNPDSLAAVGNNEFTTTPSSGSPSIGAANTGGRGSIIANSLESSTVDIGTEFTQLITFQRSYGADSKVVTTGDTMLQDLMQTIR